MARTTGLHDGANWGGRMGDGVVRGIGVGLTRGSRVLFVTSGREATRATVCGGNGRRRAKVLPVGGKRPAMGMGGGAAVAFSARGAWGSMYCVRQHVDWND